MIDQTKPPLGYEVHTFTDGSQTPDVVVRIGGLGPAMTLRCAHAIAAEEARPHVLAFAERVAAWLRDHALREWMRHVHRSPTPNAYMTHWDTWCSDVVTEAARTGAALPGEVVSDG